MDDIAGKISELLQDPNGIDRIKQMAQTLFETPNTPPTPTTSSLDSEGDVLQGLLGSLSNINENSEPGFDPMKIMGLMSVLGQAKDDKRSGLLLALKPHLSHDRQQRVDKAVKYLKIASLLPVLKDQGLLDLL